VKNVRVTVGITGGSGAIYALALLRLLRQHGVETCLVASAMGAAVMEHECGVTLDELRISCDTFFDNEDLGAAIASGSFRSNGMVIVPCSMKTLAKVAGGISDSLLTRAADVCLKERRCLVLVVRETPYSAIHLENMLRLSRTGAVILPASPAFYNHPQDIADIVRFMVGKIMDQLGIENNVCQRWNGEMRV